MAEIKQENIIYNITTQKNELTGELEKSAKAVESLDSEISDVGKDADKVFDKMGKSAKAYGEKLKEAEKEQKRLNNTITEQTRIVNDQRKELLRVEERLKNVGKNTVEYQKLTRESVKLKEAIKDTGVALQGLRIDQRTANENVKQLQRLQAEAKKTEAAVKGAGGGFGTLGKELGNLTPQVDGAGGAFNRILSTLSKLGPAGAIAAGAIGALGGAFFLAKSRIQEFSDDVDVVTNNIRLTVTRATDSIAEGFAGLFRSDQGIIQRAQNFGQSISVAIVQGATGFFGDRFGKVIAEQVFGINSVIAKAIVDAEVAAQKEREELTRLEQQQNKIRIQNIRDIADLESERRQLNQLFQERRTEGIKDEQTLARLITITNAIFDKRQEAATKQLEIAERINQLTISGNNELEQEARLYAEIKGIEAERAIANASFEKLKRFNPKDAQDENKALLEQFGILGELNRQLAELQKKRSEAKDIDTVISIDLQIKDTQDQIKNLDFQIREIISIVAEGLDPGLNPLESLLKVNADRVLPATTQREINAKIQELSNELNRTPFGTERFRELNTEIERLRKLLSAQLADTPINNILLDLKSKFDDFGKGLEAPTPIDPERLRDEAREAVQVFADFSRQILAEDIARKDRQIDLQRDRLQEFRRLAEQGNAEQLQLEEERLQKLLEARERSAQRERQIAALQIASANAVAIAEGIKNVISGFRDPVTGIANAVALAAAVGSTILAIRNSIGQIPAFAEGTEYVNLNGAPKGKDTVFARLDEGERVLTKKQNKHLKGISNEKLVQIANQYKFNELRMKQARNSPVNIDISALESGVNRTNRLLESLSLTTEINEYGLATGIGRANRNMQRRRNIAR